MIQYRENIIEATERISLLHPCTSTHQDMEAFRRSDNRRLSQFILKNWCDVIKPEEESHDCGKIALCDVFESMKKERLMRNVLHNITSYDEQQQRQQQCPPMIISFAQFPRH
eukprot:738406_1